MNAKRIDIAEFRRIGYLQELNRQFLHPLGLALEVAIDDDGTERLGGIWDYRDDPEGLRYGDGEIDPDKVRRVLNEWSRRAVERDDALGYMIQLPPAVRNPDSQPHL